MKLFIVGKIASLDDASTWEFQGVFDDELTASLQCVNDLWFVGPTELNSPLATDTVEWPDAYYPTRTRSTPTRIWSDDIVFHLNAGQHDHTRHGYTCGNDSRHRPLIATPQGWRCADCDYKQGWAHGVTPQTADGSTS